MKKKFKPKVFILDVDGVMTTGHFIYSKKGKEYKIFGPDDADALNILKKFIEIRFITADKRGLPVSKKRIVNDMGFKLDLVNSYERLKWISRKYNLDDVIFMGDGLLDFIVMEKIGLSIAPANAEFYTKKCASFITKNSGANRAVAEACLYILQKYFNINTQVKFKSLIKYKI